MSEQAGSRVATIAAAARRARAAGRHLAGRPTRANFRTGTLTVCTMVPMRSVPHRVVCLVGLDDGVFPRLGPVRRRRRAGPAPDDRGTRHPFRRPAIAARRDLRGHREAGDHLHRRRRAHRTPPAPGGAAGRAARRARPRRPRRRYASASSCEHPLQPFDIRNVTPGELVPGQPFTFDPTALVAAKAAAGDRHAAPRVLRRSRCRRPPHGDVALADLLAFFRDPVKGFFRALDYALPWEVEDAQGRDAGRDRQPRGVDGRRADAARHAGAGCTRTGAARRRVAPRHAAARPARHGARPARSATGGRAGTRGAAAPQTAAARARTTSTSTSAAARRLTGTVSPVYGERMVSVTYSGWAASTCWNPGSRCSRCGAGNPTATGPRCASGGAKQTHRDRAAALGAAAGSPRPCCATWSRSTTPAAASRCRCRSRRPSPGPTHAHWRRNPVKAAGWRVAVARQLPRRERRAGARTAMGHKGSARRVLLGATALGRGGDRRGHPPGCAAPRGCGCRCCAPRGGA